MSDVFSKTLILTSGINAESPGNLFFGDLPNRLEFNVLSGVSNNFSTVRFSKGSFKGKGSLVLGGSPFDGIVQIIDLSTNTVSGTVEPPQLKSNNITDLSD